jgi:adiponectin receptor
MLHNETMNIWSHLLGGLYFFALLWSETTAPTSFRAFYCAVTGVCFIGSALFHVLACNPTWYATAWIIDLAGMFALIGAGSGSMTFFSIGTSHGAWVYVHTGLCAGCSVLGFVLMASMVARQASSSRSADAGALRGVLPALLVCASFSYWLVAVAHVAFLEDGAMAWRCLVQLGPEWFTWGSGMLFIWKMRIPEVFVPYRFDLFGASHQIHHLVCVFCAWWHLRNAEQMHTWRPVGEMPALF